MKKIIQAVTAVVVIASMTGCATPCMTDRRRDAADIITAGVGMGIGAKARVGPVHAGLLADVPGIGLRGGSFGENHVFLFPDSFDLELLAFGLEEYDSFATPARGKDFEAGSVFPFFNVARLNGIQGGKTVATPVPYYYSQIEVVVGLGLSVRLGFNPGELLDFLLGWFGIDIYNDDIEMKILKTESNQPAQATGKPAPGR